MKMKFFHNKHLRFGSAIRRAASLAVIGAMSFIGMAASEPGEKAESKTGVTVEVAPLKLTHYGDPRLQVEFSYRVTKPLDGNGAAIVSLFNVDTGEVFSKTFSVPLSMGEHWHWAAWGGDKGPWTSSDDSELDLLLSGELISDAPVPDGFYIPQVTINGPDGNVVAEKKHSSDDLYKLRLEGAITHKQSLETIEAKAAELQNWLAEFKALSAKAREAGANTSLPDLMITALEQTVKDTRSYIKSQRWDVVSANHKYSEKQTPKTRAQFEQLIADLNSVEKIDIGPRPKERLTFKNGYFHAGDKPVFMMGMCMFAMWPDIDRIREMNFNLVHIGANPLCLFPDEKEDPAAVSARKTLARLKAQPQEFPGGATFGFGDPALIPEQALKSEGAPGFGSTPAAGSDADVWKDGDPIVIPEPTGKLLVADYNDPELTVRSFLDRCLELGIKVDLGLNMHPAPDWFFERYPDARLHGYSVEGFIPFDIEHPASLALTEKFFDAAMKEVAGHPALNSIWLANEPTLYNIGKRSAALFRKEMQEKYGTIEKLNKELQTSYADFEAIMPPDIGQGSRINVEYWWFNLRRLTVFFEFMQKCVRKYDKTVNTCFKLNNLQMGWYCPPQNVDQEAVTDISEIMGMDGGTMPFAHPYHDWLRSLSPEKPLVNLEFKGGGEATWLTMWRAALWGTAGLDWWCWHADPDFSSAMCYTVSLHDGPLAMSQIQRNIDVVMEFQQFPRSPFVFIYPDPVIPRVRGYFNVHTPTYHAVSQLGYAVDYATEKRIDEGRLEQMPYTIAVLPALNYVRDETLERIGAFVERGGEALVVGPLPTLDPAENPRADMGWLKAPEGARQGIPSCTNSIVYQHGRGRVWMLPEGNETTLRGWIGEVAAAALPPRPVIVDPEFESRTIRWKDAKGEDAYVTYILANYYQKWDVDVEKDARVDVDFAGPVAEAVDLITGERLDPANITISRYGARLIQWKPEKR